MLASALITLFSIILLVYWFRCTCLLLLRNGQAAASSGEGLRLSYRHVLEQGGDQLDPLHQALNRDYAVLTYLLSHAAGLDINPIERHMLTADFKVMGFWYRLTKSTAPTYAGEALREMASVVDFFALRMGEQATAQSNA
jgi:hypothetical protein